MGEKSRFLQDAFFHWVFGGMRNVAIVEQEVGLVERSWRALCSQLLGCGDSMSTDLCRRLGVPPGSSYALASRRLLDEIGTGPTNALRDEDSERRMTWW